MFRPQQTLNSKYRCVSIKKNLTIKLSLGLILYGILLWIIGIIIRNSQRTKRVDIQIRNTLQTCDFRRSRIVVLQLIYLNIFQTNSDGSVHVYLIYNKRLKAYNATIYLFLGLILILIS